MTFWRKAVFYTFVGLYCLICPLTIGYALGYLYQPGETNLIVKSGLIYLSTLPPGAGIAVNRLPHPEKTPAVLRGLVAGEYDIEISLPGYKPWKQTVPVEAEKATVLENILLVASAIHPEIISDRRWEKLVILKDPIYLALGEGQLLSRSAVLDARETALHPLISAESALASAEVLSFYTVPESPCALLRVRHEKREKYLWLDALERPVKMTDATHFFSKKPERVEWDARERNIVYAFAGGALDAYDIQPTAVRRPVLSGLRGYGIFDRKIFAIDGQGRLKRHSIEGAVESELLSDPALTETLFGEGDFFQIQILDKQNYLFLRDDGALFSNKLPYHFVKKGVRGWDWEPHQKRLVLWQRDRLGVVDFNKPNLHDDLFERGPQLAWVFRKAAGLTSAAWIHRGSQILFQDGQGVFVIDLETYGKPTLHRIVDAKPGTAIYSKSLGRLFYLDPATTLLRSLEIVPRRTIPLLTFPERDKEKKKTGIPQL